MKNQVKLFISWSVISLLLSGVNSEVQSVCCTNQNSDGPVVRFSHGGEVEGKTLTFDEAGSMKRVNQFLGIPYAEPPLRELRFAAPKKKTPWSDRLQAKKPPVSCWQLNATGFDLNNEGALMWYNNTPMNEDCLYLNIWAPNVVGQNETLPVMVWIYGGGFYSGTSTLDVYNGSILAATQNVIVVSMQYRVGAFGFLRVAPQGGKRIEDATGNEGLLDQEMALQWVQENIGLFNGNKDLVTIFGESAGAVSVSALWLSPRTQNLFRRAIMQSASIYARWAYSTIDDAHKRANAFIKACKCDPEANRQKIMDCLRAVKEKDLVDNLNSINVLIGMQRNTTIRDRIPELHQKIIREEISPYLYFDAPLRPVVDGEFITGEPDQMFQATERRNASELLIGVNQNEGMYFLLGGLLLKNTTFLTPEGQVELPEAIMNHYRKGDLVWASIAQFLDEDLIRDDNTAKRPAYMYGLGKENETTRKEDLMQRMDSFVGDLDFTCPTVHFANKASELDNVRVYLYSFHKRTQEFPMPPWVGVMHGYEIEYVFGMPRSEQFRSKFYKFNGQEKNVSDKVMDMWANFARIGNPTPDDSTDATEWPTYEPSDQQYMIINDTLRISQNLRKQFCDFWLQNQSEK